MICYDKIRNYLENWHDWSWWQEHDEPQSQQLCKLMTTKKVSVHAQTVYDYNII